MKRTALLIAGLALLILPHRALTQCTFPQKVGGDVRITNAASDSLHPSQVWTGSAFGVSWYDKRDGNYEIYFVRFSSSGAKIGSDLRVTSATSDSIYPSLSWTGSEFGVSWQDYRDGNYEIYFARISAAGEKIGSDLRVTNDANISANPSLSWTGSEFGVSWHDARDAKNYDGNYEIYFARISSSGSKIGSDLRITNNTAVSAWSSLSWTGSEFGVSWQDYRSANYDGNYEIYFARISSAGAKIGADLRVTNNAGYSAYPSLIWTGTEFGVSWQDYRDAQNYDGNYEIYFARLTSAGTKIGPDLRITYNAGGSYYSSLSWTGSEFGVSWYDGREGNYEVYFARISSAGIKVGGDLRFTNNPGWSEYPSISWTGSEFGVSWQDDRDGNREIYFARIGCGNCNLTGLDIIPVAGLAGGTINLAEGALQTFTAACTYIGSNCGVLSDDCSQAEGVSWNYAGQVSLSTLGQNTSTVATANQIPGLNGGSGQVFGSATCGAGSYNDSTNIIVLNDDTKQAITVSPGDVIWDLSVPHIQDFYSYLIWSDGYIQPEGAGGWDFASQTCLGSAIDANGVYTVPAQASDCTDVVRKSDPPASPGLVTIILTLQSCIYQQKIGPDLRLTNAANSSELPSLAWAGSEYGVSWQDNRDGNYEIYFARISPSGVKLGSDLRITFSMNDSLDPSLVWTGSEFAVSWRDLRSGFSYISFARINAQGAKIGNDIIINGSDTVSYDPPSLVWNGAGYGLAWTNSLADIGPMMSKILVARLSEAGVKIGTEVEIPPSGVSGCDSNDSVLPSIFWNGAEYGLAWNGICISDVFPPNSGIYFTRLSSQLSPTGELLSKSFLGGWSEIKNSLNWTGSEFGLSWSGIDYGNDVYLTRISSTGVQIGADIPVNNPPLNGQYPALAWTGSEYGVSWNDTRDGNWEIYFAPFLSHGAPLGPNLRITNDPGNSLYPSLAWSGYQYGVAWQDNRDGNEEIYFTLIGCGCPGDSDCDGMPDWWEIQHGLNSLVNDASGDADGDGLTNLQEYLAGTNPRAADTDGDGLNDKAELDLGLDPLNPDTDGDNMPDGWEAAMGTNPLIADANLDDDGDGLSNLDEYYNGSDPKSREPHGRAGMGYFGDADGTLSIGFPDSAKMVLVLSGNSPSYDSVYPPSQLVQDLDGTGSIGFPDLTLLTLLLSGNTLRPAGWPTTLDQETPTGIPLAPVGQTVAIRVRLTKSGSPALARPGFGVVFSVSEGTATLYGGEGAGPTPGSRYDLTNLNGEARIVLRVDAAVTIKVHVELPSPNPVLDKIVEPPVVLPSDVEIMGIP